MTPGPDWPLEVDSERHQAPDGEQMTNAGEVLLVVAAAVIHDHRLLVVSKRAAARVFFLPGGKPHANEDNHATLVRELNEELGVRPLTVRPFGVVVDTAALELVPMRMSVFLTTIAGIPTPASEIAAFGWTTGTDEFAPLLAPAVRNHVVPDLVRAGFLAGHDTPPG